MAELTLDQRRAMALAAARVRAQESEAAPSTQRGLANQYANEDVGQMGAIMRGLGGAKASFDRAAMGLKGVFTDLTPEDKALLEQGRAFEKEGGPAATVGSIGADVAMSAAPGGMVTKAVKGAPLLARTLAELGYGAGYGALTSPEDRTGGAAGGAIGTGVGMGVNRLVGGAIKPFVSKEAQALADQGIQATPGQAIGGMVNQAEQKLKSLPLVGDVIRNARNRSVNEFNEKAIQTAVPDNIGYGDEALTAARETLGRKYDSILEKLPKISLEREPIMNTALGAANDASLGLSKDSKSYIMDYVNRHMLSRGQNMTGDVAKRVESDLLNVIQSKRGSQDGEQRAIGEALSKIHETWRDSLASAAEAVNPGAGSALLENNRAWRAFVALDRAGAYRGNQNVAANDIAGRFTPNSLRRSIEASDTSQFNNATRGMDYRTTKPQTATPAAATAEPSGYVRPGTGPIIPEYAELGVSQPRLGYDLPQIGRNGPVLAPDDIRTKSITDWLRMRMGGQQAGAAAADATQAAPQMAKPSVSGEAPFNKLSRLTRQAEKVLGDNVPDSGTATRLMMGAGALGAGSAAGMDMGDTAMGAALTLPFYSRTGSKFLMQGLEPAYKSAVQALTLRGVPTQAVDDVLRKYGPEGVIGLARGYGVNQAN